MSAIPARRSPTLGIPTTPSDNAAVAPALTVTAARQPHTNANRQAMPIIASVVDQFRKVFGSDQVRVAYAEEVGRKLGTPQPPGIKPVITDAGAPKRTTRKALRP